LSKEVTVENITDVAELFKVFGDSTRIRILLALKNGELCVMDISEKLEMSISGVSHQLAILRRADLVRNRKEGKTVYYSIADDHVHTMLAQGLEHIKEEK